MAIGGERQGDDADLALAGEPVRHWLTRFFQRRTGNGADVDDLVQDVFVRMVSRDDTRRIESLGGYILKTALSVLADRGRYARSRRFADHVPFDTVLHGGEDIGPERVLSGREELNAATAALLSLPERTRTVFVLRRFEGMRHREIATQLEISVSAVEKHMVRAIRHLGGELEQRLGS